MKISIIGNSLTGLILAKALANKNINFEIFYKAKTQNLKSNRTIAITNKNMAFLKADILSIPKKLVNPVNEIGILTENDLLKEVLNFDNKKVADIPIPALSDKAPLYERKWTKPKLSKTKVKVKDLKKIKIEDALIKILSSPNHSNKNCHLWD